MGSRFTLNLSCAYCKTLNKQVYYAESSGFDSFKCFVCGEKNLIVMDFIAVKDEVKA
jgi:hypothetical protein